LAMGAASALSRMLNEAGWDTSLERLGESAWQILDNRRSLWALPVTR
jgi:hypothetical protein